MDHIGSIQRKYDNYICNKQKQKNITSSPAAKVSGQSKIMSFNNAGFYGEKCKTDKLYLSSFSVNIIIVIQNLLEELIIIISDHKNQSFIS